MVSVNDYTEERTCIYKDEIYSVRDNGAIKRHAREDMRKRKLDEVWSFGTQNKNGYLDFCGERVHRIVATAFHGPSPEDGYVVDHIDTNRQNNRPENLRWLSKLENILNNEITRKKVEMICGSIEAFLENPNLLYGYETEDPNFNWMRRVTKEEAERCLKNWTNWAKTATPKSDYVKKENHIGEGIYKNRIKINSILDAPIDLNNPYMNKIPTGKGSYKNDDIPFTEDDYKPEFKEEDLYYESKTPTALQLSWRTPTEFPCCPNEVTEDGLMKYKDNLKESVLFSSNNFSKYYVVDSAINPNNEIIVLSSSGEGEGIFGAYSLVSIKINKGKFIHTSLKRFGNKENAMHFFNLLAGKEKWTEDDENLWDCI